MARRDVLEKLSPVAREQAGYVTAAEAKRVAARADDLARMAIRHEMRRVSRGVYAFPGSFASPREETIAAWLRLEGSRLPWDTADPAAVVSHASAAAVHGFGTIIPTAPSFTVFERRFRPSDDSRQVYTARLEPADWAWVALPEGIRLPVTTPARTIVDLAYAGEQRDQVLDALAEAREAGLVDDEVV